MPTTPNPASLIGQQQDERINGLPLLPTGTDRTTLLVPVYDPATDQTCQAPLVANDGALTANAVIGGHKQVQYRSSLLYGVPAAALTLDRLSPKTIVPGTLATVDNPSDTPLSTTLPPRQYVATRTASSTAGAVQVPAYLGAGLADRAYIIWVEVVAGSGASNFAQLGGQPGDNAALAAALAGKADLDSTGKVPLAQTQQQYKWLYEYAAGQTTQPEKRLIFPGSAGYYAVEQTSNATSLEFYLNDVGVAPDAQGRFTLAYLDRFAIKATAPAGQAGYVILAQVV